MGENEESSVDPHLKHIKNQMLMFESEIESCIELVVSGIDSEGRHRNSRRNIERN